MSFARALSKAIRAARTPCAVPRYLLSWPVSVLLSAALVPCAIAQTTTFGSTGNVQTYTVPAGAAGVTILASGAGGGGGGADEAGPGATGGSGAAATGKYPVTGGTVLNVYVGGGGTGGQTSNGAFNCTNSEGAGGSGSGLFAGGAGGNAGCHGWSGGGGGGGGASAVTSGATVILIAGGGGGGQGGSLSSSSVPSQNSTAVGALPGSVGGIGGSFGPSPTLDGGGGGGGGGGCPGGAGGSDHPDSTGTNFGTAAGPGSSCSNASVTGFAITGLGGAGGFGAPGSVYTGGGTGAAGSVSITPYYSATLNASAAFPASVNAGQTVSGTVSLSNQGPSPASNPALALTLPANLSTAPTITGLPAGAGFVYTPATGAVSFTNLPATLAASASIGPLAVSFVQPASGNSTVTVQGTTSTPDPNPASGQVSVSIGGNPVATLVSSATFPANVNAGQTVSGTVSFTNQGPSTATNTTFSLTLPANLSTAPTITGLPAGAGFVYTPATGAVSFTNLPTNVAANATIGPLAVSYVQPPSGSSTVVAHDASSTLDPTPASSTATATVGGNPVATLVSSATFPANVNAGQTVSGTVSFTNQGPSTATNTTFSLTLPANLSTAPTITGLPAGAGFVYTPATGAVSFTNLPTSLAANATLGPFSVSYLQISSGRSTVLATITSATSDPNPSMRSASATVLGAALQVSGVVFIDAGQTGVYASSDPPVAGATVELVASGRVVATATTNAQGNYFFTSEPAGSYSVALTPRSGFLSSTPAEVPVAISDAGFSTVNFGLIADAAAGTLVLTKTTPLVDIAAGQSVPYTITATNSGKTSLPAVSLADLMPAGFRYRAGSGAVNGHRQEPKTAGRELTWTPLQFAPGEKKTLTLVLTAGAGITGGTFVNSASALNALTHTVISNMATATVRMTGDPTFDCPDLIGKVFDDRNSNGRQDPGEPGIAGVRLVSTQGLLITTDAQGRYHIACPIQPDPSLGTNYELKLDERTLPSGYRLTTDNPGIIRLTAGKLSSLNFGAAVGHVVRIELAGSAFQSNQPGTDLQQRLAALEPLLGQGTSIIRIAYRAADESDATIATRIASVRAAIEGACRARDCPLLPRIEEEIVKPTGETVPGGSP